MDGELEELEECYRSMCREYWRALNLVTKYEDVLWQFSDDGGSNEFDVRARMAREALGIEDLRDEQGRSIRREMR